MSDKKNQRDIIKAFNEQLKVNHIAEGLEVGTTAPDFSLLDENSQKHNLYTQLLKGMVILSFYRGDWCPICIRELNDLQNYYKQLNDLNCEVWAISPQTSKEAKGVVEKHHYSFPLLSDPDQAVIKSYKLDFLLSEEIQQIYTKINLDLTKRTADGSWNLPVPATYIIGQDQTILFKFADRDYWNRLETTKLLKILKDLK